MAIMTMWILCILIGHFCGKYIENIFVSVGAAVLLSSVVCIIFRVMLWT